MTKYVRVKERKEKSRLRKLNLLDLEAFKSGCDFFDLNLQEFYILLHNKCNVDDYYSGYDSFKLSWHQHRETLAQKDGIIASVDSLRDVMNSNLMKAVASPGLIPFLKKKWKDRLDEIMER